MRLAAPALALMALTAPVAAVAQVQDDIALTRAEIQTERQAIVAENMMLSDAEAQTFWPMYRDYRNQMAQVGDKALKLLQNYAATYDHMTDQNAVAMMDQWFQLQEEEQRIKKNWTGKFSKSFNAKTAMRFLQIENKLDAIIRADAAFGIPLVEHKPKP